MSAITPSPGILKAYDGRPRNRWKAVVSFAVVAAALLWSALNIEFRGVTSRGSEAGYGILHGIFNPDTKVLLDTSATGVAYLLFETAAIALLGTLFGGVLAIPFAFLSSHKIVPKPVAFLARSLVMMVRTIPSLVWALIWIRVTGPGPLCGVVTQSVVSIGMISRMYMTAIDDVDTRILESLDAMGCTRLQKIRYGILPQLSANMVSTLIYRFDINIKDATTLGVVGAGGIGAVLIQALSTRRWGIAGAFLTGMILLMLVIEYFSTRMRRRLAQGV
ncbi:MAG TPA: ABC transporter permease subunit [Candidatus Limnocylindria bacterium]|nr:ABC transporter permease subunit [Candidatus Limnocylindria bacterium]